LKITPALYPPSAAKALAKFWFSISGIRGGRGAFFREAKNKRSEDVRYSGRNHFKVQRRNQLKD
jgi:hypothetical protein